MNMFEKKKEVIISTENYYFQGGYKNQSITYLPCGVVSHDYLEKMERLYDDILIKEKMNKIERTQD